MLQKYYDIVEKGIKLLDIDPDKTRGQKKGQWDFNRGSAKIAVGLSSTDRFPNGYFYVSSIILEEAKVPLNRKEELFRTLLEINASLVNMRFAFGKGIVFLISNRDAAGLDPEEVATTINELSYYADYIDDKLEERFKA